MNQVFQIAIGIVLSVLGLILTVASLLGGIDVHMTANGGPAGGALFLLMLIVGVILLLCTSSGGRLVKRSPFSPQT